jgi:acyl carrier protein
MHRVDEVKPMTERSLALDRSAWTATEQRLASIWNDVLGAADIDLDDDFLVLGGDSISATQCANAVYDSFGVDLEIELLLDELSTVRSIAGVIDGRRTPKVAET